MCAPTHTTSFCVLRSACCAFLSLTSCLCAQNPSATQFGVDYFPEGPSRARSLSKIASKTSLKLATKIGDGTLTLASPPEAMYGVAKNVGGERADNFHARNSELRRSTPHPLLSLSAEPVLKIIVSLAEQKAIAGKPHGH
jgi:hypothetical protein